MGAVFHSTSSLVCNEADIRSNQRGLFYDSTQKFKHGSNTIKVSVFDEPFAVAKKKQPSQGICRVGNFAGQRNPSYSFLVTLLRRLFLCQIWIYSKVVSVSQKILIPFNMDNFQLEYQILMLACRFSLLVRDYL